MEWDPVRRQQAAIMIKAIEDLSSSSKRIRLDAARWILNDDFHVNTFRGICFDLGYDAEEWRKKLVELGLDPQCVMEGHKPRRFRLKKLLQKLINEENKKLSRVVGHGHIPTSSQVAD